MVTTHRFEGIGPGEYDCDDGESLFEARIIWDGGVPRQKLENEL
jgi:hypothetical protein